LRPPSPLKLKEPPKHSTKAISKFDEVVVVTKEPKAKILLMNE